MSDALSPTSDRIERSVVSAIRKTAKNALPDVIAGEHSFISDLDFDSMSISLLGLALEDEFGCAILLSGWVERHSHPESLTVRSLCEYLAEVLPAS
jgi:acyl carrier protein